MRSELCRRSTFPFLTLVVAALAVSACEDDPDPPLPDAAIVDAPVSEAGADRTPTPDAMETGGDLGPVATSVVTILHTNDLHSYLQGHGPEADYTPATTGDDMTIGGYARLATAIGTHKTMAGMAGNDVLLVDAGDFMMGTLFELGAANGALELKLMEAVRYDAATIGNHEYDWTTRGLAAILKAAYTVEPKVTFPLLASNLQFSDTSADDDDLAMFQDPGPIKRKFIKTLGSGLKVGFFGLLGLQAQTFAPSAKPLTFENPQMNAAKMVAELRNTDKVDLVVALSHSGINAQGMGEDAMLAAAVPGIDVIVSGHSHDKLTMPAMVGRTIIVTAGSYGEYLGRLDLNVTRAGTVVTGVSVKEYRLLPIDDQIAGNAATQTNIDNAIQLLDAELAASGLSYKRVLAETSFDLKRAPYKEFGLGDLITDAFRLGVSKLQPDDPPVIAVEANGGIRADVQKGKTGNIWFADLFRVMPLGIGPDRVPGYPLVTYYLTGKDLKAGLEVSAGADTAALNDDAYFMQMSGMEADFDKTKPLFQRVTAARIKPDTGAAVPIDFADTTKCYKVVSTIYLAGLLGLVKDFSQGLVTVVAKEKDCTTPIANLATRIVDSNPATPAVEELKQWQALAGFVSMLPDNPDMTADPDTVPDVPAAYQAAQGRIKITP
jgi:5'-nucleotidase/UDP-sugar diphosphatase